MAPPAPRKAIIIPAKTHFRSTDLRSAARLAVEAALGVTGIVEHLHHNIGRLAPPLGKAPDRPTGGVTGLVYRSVRGVMRISGAALDLLLRPVEAMLRRQGEEDEPGSGEREAVVAALNGVIGDHLASTGNALAIPMTLLHGGRPLRLGSGQPTLDIPAAKPRVLVLVHGLCMHPGQWGQGGEDPGIGLAQAHASTLLHLHYNTGRRIGTNGREFSRLLEELTAAWPVPMEEIAIVAHSMGGLVARSACHCAVALGHRWPILLRRMVFLGTPHLGSPLERGGHVVDVVLGASPYTAAFARIGGQRSAGINDLRHGSLVEDDDPARPLYVPLPEGVACHAVAGVLAGDGESVKSRLLGDGLVSVDSALGRNTKAAPSLAFGPDRQMVAHGVGHLGLLSDRAVLDQVAAWLSRPLA